MVTKREITQRLISLLANGDSITVDKALKTWYVNLRETGGLRLTLCGYQILNSLDIQSWAIPLDNNKSLVNKKLLLDLDKKIIYPYYIDNKHLVLFSSKEAMMALLYGNIHPWLSGQENRIKINN